MKRRLLMTAASLALCGSTALAVTAEDVIADLQGQGYANFEVKVGPGQIKVEASNGTDRLELVVDRETGNVLKSEVYPGQGGEVDPGIDIDIRDKDFVDDGDDDGDDDNSGHGSDDDGDDDNSGHGSDDDGDDDNSGHGGGGSGSSGSSG